MDGGSSIAVRHGATCMFCIPLRLGILLNAVGTIVGSFFMIFMKHSFEENMRIFGGGYVMISRVLIGFLEISGSIWGIIGFMGAWQCKEHYLQIYNTYQMARVVVWLGMYITDGPVLWHCELWMTDIKAAIEMQGYNPIMYRIALEGRCAQERFYFFFFSSIGLMFFIYLTRVNQIFQQILAAEPAYLLRIPKHSAGGAFYAESLGETQYLLRGQDTTVGPAIHAPRSGTEAGAYNPNREAYGSPNREAYGGPQSYDGGHDHSHQPVRSTAWEGK